MFTLAEKAERFRALHQRPGAFIIPNPWDIGSAILLARLGFEALATTSGGFAFSRGRSDGTIGRDEMLRHAADLAAAVDLPVSCDLGNGFGDAPETVAETIGLAAAAGLAGASIEDASGDSGQPIYAFDLARKRIQAAAAAARSLPHPFMLTARAENFLHGRRDLGDTIRRLQAFQDAGADVLYAPGLASADDVKAVIGSVDRPLNVLAGVAGAHFTFDGLAALGVKRISIGSALARTAYSAMHHAALEMRELGSFGFTSSSIPFREMNAWFTTADDSME